MKKYIVTNTPWGTLLPQGTEIEPVEVPAGKIGHWFKIKGSTGPFLDNEQGFFRLFPSEFTTQQVGEKQTK